MDADKLIKGNQAVPSRGGRRRFTPTIYWKKDGEAKYLLFVTDYEDTFVCLTHPFIQTANGPRSFVCRKDTAFLDESEGACLICDDLEQSPVYRRYAVAFELEAVEEVKGGRKTPKEFVVATNEVEVEVEGVKETKYYPKVGVICQSDKNFFPTLEAYENEGGKLSETVVKIIKNGAKQNVSYSALFSNVAPPDIEEHLPFAPSLLDYIADQGSEARYLEELAGVTVDDQLSEDRVKGATAADNGTEEESSDDEKIEKLRERIKERG